MAVVNVLAFCLLVLSLSLYWKEEIVEVLPMAACFLVLFLYPLAMVCRLSCVDLAGLLFVLAWGVWILRQDAERRKQLWKETGRLLRHPGVTAAVLLLAGTAFLVRGRVAVWWDDVNYWAADVKALYLLDGFASRYTNVSPEFGDYPPGLQLLKWWFLHLSPGHFSEGLMFAGYYFGVFVFFLPLLRRLRGGTVGRNLIFGCLAAAGIWVFPSVAEVFYCQGMCADLAMAALYGAFLAAATDGRGHRRGFYSLRLSLYLAVLVLIKSVGFLWAGFAFLFLCGYRLAVGDRKPWKQAKLLLLPAGTGGSWLIFCLVRRRVARLTGAAVSMAAGHLPILLEETRAQLLRAFGEAFVFWPLHREHTWALDLSPLVLLLILTAAALAFWRKGVVSKRAGQLLCVFVPLSGLIFYGIDLVSHLTIFASEMQYLDPYAMLSSIERYGAPFAVGTGYLLAFLLLEWAAGALGGTRNGMAHAVMSGVKPEVRPEVPPGGKAGAGSGAVCRVYLALLLCVTVCADWPQAGHALFGYWSGRREALSDRAEMTAGSAPFLAMLERMKEPVNIGLYFDADRGVRSGSEKDGIEVGIRVICVRDAEKNAWVNNAYTAYEAAPVSLVFAGMDASYMGYAEALSPILASHAGYLYADPMSAENEALLAENPSVFVENAGTFAPGVLYKLETKDGVLHLTDTGIRADISGE